MRKLTPSADCAAGFGHDAARWPGFRERCAAELADNAVVVELRELVQQHRRVTLLPGAKDTQHNNAVALQHSLAAEAIP